MGIFSFGKKDDAAPRRRGAEAGSNRRSSQSTRVERRSRRPDRSADAEAMLLDPTLPEKQRARRRLVGAIALVVAAIVILPMVLDSHPKPVTDDIAIDIPSRPVAPGEKAAARDDADSDDTQAGVAPDNPGASNLAAVAPGASAAGSAQTAQSSQSANTAGASAKAPAQTQAQTQTPPAAKTAQAQTSSSSATKSSSKPAATQANTAVASNQNTDTTAGSGGSGESGAPGARFAVQLGSFSSAGAANNWVTKLKAVGVPAYTEQRKQPDGSTRTLLRAGPFPDRAAASEAIAKVRGAGLMAGSNGSAD